MKFLYVANERQAAEQAGLALRSVAPDVAVSWAASLGQARRWIDENRNVAALIIEVESDSRSFEALVTHARGIGVKVPVIGIPLIETSDVLTSVRAVADEVVPRDAAFLDELPQAVSRSLFPRNAQVQQISVPPYDHGLQQRLRDAEAAAARADERAQEVLDQRRAREERLHAVIEQERAVRVELERRLEDAESARQEAEAAQRDADRRLVRDAAAFAEDLSHRDKELADATTVRQSLEERLTNALSELEQVRERESALTENLSDDARSLAQELAEAKRIVRLADQLHATTKAAADARIKDIQEQTDARLAEATSITNALQRELAGTVAKHAESDLAHRKAIQALEATRQDLGARLMAAHDAHRQLEEQHASAMVGARAALLTAEQRANKQQTDAAAAAQSLGTKLADSVANADRLRAQLSEARLALTSAEQQATADQHAATEQIAGLQATFDAALADEVTRREALASDLAERDLAHQNAIQVLEAARQDLEARLAAADATRRQLEEQHASASAAARAALESAEQRANKQQTDAAAATRAFDAKLAESVANADRLHAQLSEAQLALTSAEQQATADRQAAAEQLAKQQATFDAALEREVTRRRTWTAELAERELAHQKALKGLEATHQDLEGRLAAADEARRQLEEQHETSIAVVRGALDAVERRADKQQAEAAAAAHALKTDLAESLAEADRLRAELSETEVLLTQTKQQAASDRQLAAEEARRRQTEFEASIGKEVADRQTLQMGLAEFQQQAEARATQAASDLAALQSKLAEQAAALLEAERQADSDRHDAAEQAARRQAAFDTELAEQVAQRQNVLGQLSEAKASLETLQARLADTTAALQSAETQAAHDRQAAAQEAATRQTEFEASLAREIANTQAAVKQLADQRRNAAAELADHRQRADRQIAALQQQAEARLAEAMATAAATLEASLQQARAERESAAEQAAQHQARFDAELAQEIARGHELTAAVETLEAKLADTTATLQRAVTQATDDRRTAAETAATQQAEFEASLAREVANTQAAVTQLAEQRRNAAAELADHRQRADRQVAALQQQADARLAEAMATAAATLEASLQQASAEREAAAEQAAQQQARFDTELAQEVVRRQNLAAKLTEAEAAQQKADADHAVALTAAHEQLSQHQHEAETRRAQLTAGLEALETRLADTTAALQRAMTQAADDRRTAAETQRQADARLAEAMANAAATLEASQQSARAERQAAADQFAEQRGVLEAELARARQSIGAGQAQIQQLEALSRDQASERTRLQAIVAERDRQLAEQAKSHQVANEAAAKSMADVEHRLKTALDAGRRDAQTITQLNQQIAARGKDLEALNHHRDALKREADRVPVLEKLIDATQAEHRRRFDHTPVGMWRSRPDGAIVQANQALVSLLRYKTVDALLDVNFSTTVFESADELQWLVDRCLASRTTETVETTWRRKDGVGIVVRLMAIASSPEAVDFVAMDITNLRALEEKLRNSQRMESVARYASEVAVTCNKLLGQVNQQGQQWLTRIESDSARHQGALLLDDVTRAAGFLGQLTVYGTEQKNAPELVEVKQVLQDLEPILTRVAGSRVDIVVPKSSSPYHLDVDIERVERILVNVAAYGRERMPFGGRLMIDVSPVVVDRTFVEKHPNVRPGAHVLLTVSEKKGATGPDLSMTVRDQTSGNGSALPTQKPGVDLGVLQTLVSDCGGHLWILAEPGGNLELRIHLPRRVLDDRAPAKKAGRGRWMSKLTGVRNREAV